MTSQNLEIPGFYRHPTNGRYFRIRDSTTGAPAPGPAEVNAARPGPASTSGTDPGNSKLVTHFWPKYKNIPSILRSFQNGFVDPSSFERQVSILRLENLKESEELCLPDWNTCIPNEDIPRLANVYFLKGGYKSLYGVWNLETKRLPYYGLGEITHRFTPNVDCHWYRMPNISSRVCITDICEGLTARDCMLYVAIDPKSNSGVVKLTWRAHSIEPFRETSQHFSASTPVWCCNYSHFTRKFAIGAENGILLYNVDSFPLTKKVIGNIHSVQFNETGNLIYSGIHTGACIIVDVRTPDLVETMRLHHHGIDETVLLKDENYLIVGGFSGMLCKVDLRTKQKVTEYLGHVHTPRKVPFSISETHNLLCATGSDNVTRLWSLNGGEPIKYIKPKQERSPARAWLVSDHLKFAVYVVQGEKMYLYDT